MPTWSKYFITAGIVLILFGILYWLFHSKGWAVGRLPGDFFYENGNFRVYAPITTMLLVSILFNLVLWLVKKGL